jgi:hypothetical protein
LFTSHDDPDYWRKRAEEARVLAEEYRDEMAKAALLKVAEECDKLACNTGEAISGTKQS